MKNCYHGELDKTRCVKCVRYEMEMDWARREREWARMEAHRLSVSQQNLNDALRRVQQNNAQIKAYRDLYLNDIMGIAPKPEPKPKKKVVRVKKTLYERLKGTLS